RKCRAQRLVATNDLAETLLEGGEVVWSGQSHRERNVVGRIVGIELIDKPKPLLRKRERQRAFSGNPLNCGQRLATGIDFQLNYFSQTRDRRRFEYHAQRQLDLKHFPDLRDRLRRHQRMATNVE